MATRIENQVAADVNGRSLSSAPECTGDNPTGMQRADLDNGPSIRAIRPGEIVYGSIDATPDARAVREVMKVIDSVVSSAVEAAPKIVVTPGRFRIFVAIHEVYNAAQTLKVPLDEFGRNLQAISNEKARQYLIKAEGEMNDRIESVGRPADGDLKRLPLDDQGGGPPTKEPKPGKGGGKNNLD
ncbi:hypothetical protein [Paraburkholderia terrae]